MIPLLSFASIGVVSVLAGLARFGRLHRWIFGQTVSRPPTVTSCRGLGPLQVTSISDGDDELLVRLDSTASLPTATSFVVCLASGENDRDLLTRWHRRLTLVWLQQDDTNQVVLFAGAKRIVVELWSPQRSR